MNSTAANDKEHNRELEGLLDEALAPPTAPADLTDRIVAKTSPLLSPPLSTPHRGVLARIGPEQWRAIAAVLLLSLSVLAIIVASMLQRPTPPDSENGSANFGGVAFNLEIDQELESLALQIDELEGQAWQGSNWSIEIDLSEFESQFGDDASALF